MKHLDEKTSSILATASLKAKKRAGVDLAGKSASRAIVANKAENRESQYQMNIAVQPPSESRPGDLLNPPIVVTLEGQRLQDVDDANIWGLVSVVSADGLQAISPPQPNLISGTLVDSIHSVFSGQGRRERKFLSFPRVAINQAGKYRIRICLVKMRDIQCDAVNMQSIMTRVIRVDTQASAPSLGKSFILAGEFDADKSQVKRSERF